MRSFSSHRQLLFLLLLAVGFSFAGCSWLHSLKPTDESRTFPKWSEEMTSSSGTSAKSVAREDGETNKHKSLFFDERSRAVEKSMGYED